MPAGRAVIAATLLALSAAAGPARAADSDATTAPILPSDKAEPYTHPQLLVEVAPGRRLNLYCSGNGSPTVVMDSGWGNSAWPWGLVQPAVAGLTRVCSYDRAGEGWSEPGPLPRTSSAIVADLRALLSAAGEAPPYVLVGHSFGGLNVTLYAHLHPEDLVGLVEVDPSVAGQDLRQAEEIPFLGEQVYENNRQTVKSRRHCATLARAGALADDTQQEQTGCTLIDGDSFDPTLQAGLVFFATRASQWVTLASEFKQLAATRSGVQATDTDEIEVARRDLGHWPLGALPLVVLQAGDVSEGGFPPDVQSQYFQLRTDLLSGVAAQSRRGERIVVPSSGHYIQLEQPQAVIDAITKVVCAARAEATVPCQ